jgi:hypothetical protein
MEGHMKIINKTNLNTKLLGAFIRRVAVHEQLTQNDIDKFDVRIIYRRQSRHFEKDHTGGYAWLRTWSFVLKVPKNIMPNKPAMAKTIAHELAHCQGVRHGSAMNNPQYGWYTGWQEYWKWAEELPLAFNVPDEKPKLKGDALVLKKLEHCQAAIVKWERKARLAKTKQHKWVAKAKYYEKQLQKAAMSPPADGVVKNIIKKLEPVLGLDEVAIRIGASARAEIYDSMEGAVNDAESKHQDLEPGEAELILSLRKKLGNTPAKKSVVLVLTKGEAAILRLQASNAGERCGEWNVGLSRACYNVMDGCDEALAEPTKMVPVPAVPVVK